MKVFHGSYKYVRCPTLKVRVARKTFGNNCSRNLKSISSKITQWLDIETRFPQKLLSGLQLSRSQSTMVMWYKKFNVIIFFPPFLRLFDRLNLPKFMYIFDACSSQNHFLSELPAAVLHQDVNRHFLIFQKLRNSNCCVSTL